MMQILKKEISDRIIDSAKNEFKENGYDNTSMRKIARNADVSVGNLYRYYTNKEEIFEKIVKEPYNQIIKFIKEDKAFAILDREGDYSNFEKEFKYLANIFYKYKDEFIIIIYGSKGTRYERAKELFISLVEEKVLKSIRIAFENENISENKIFLGHVISVSLVEGLIVIIKEHEDTNRVKEIVEKVIKFIFKDFYLRFDI